MTGSAPVHREALVTVARDDAEARDRADPLARFHDRFVPAEPGLVYLDGNSLGRLPRATVERLTAVVAEQWGERLIRGWWEEWLELPGRVGDLIGGRRRGGRADRRRRLDDRVSLQARFRRARPRSPPRRDRGHAEEFPTDRYVLESLAAARGLELRWLDADPVEGRGRRARCGRWGRARRSSSSRTSTTAPPPSLPSPTSPRLVHDAGALVLWDLCHSAGVAAGRAGRAPAPTSPSAAPTSTSTADRARPRSSTSAATCQTQLRQPIWGWFGRRDQFLMEHGYEPADGDRRVALGHAERARAQRRRGGCAADGGGDDPGASRRRRARSTEYAIELHDAPPGAARLHLGSPRDRVAAELAPLRPPRRGASALRRSRRRRRDHRLPDAGHDPARLLAADDELRRGLEGIDRLCRARRAPEIVLPRGSARGRRGRCCRPRRRRRPCRCRPCRRRAAAAASAPAPSAMTRSALGEQPDRRRGVGERHANAPSRSARGVLPHSAGSATGCRRRRRTSGRTRPRPARPPASASATGAPVSGSAE